MPRVIRPFLMAHGGAGPRAMTKAQRVCLAEALAVGYEILSMEARALNAVEIVIRMLEGSGLFNAGVGSRSQLDDVRRMDASIMEGRELRAGAVAAIEGIRHPISAARLVMEETDHVLLVGRSASALARHFKLERQLHHGSVGPNLPRRNRVGSAGRLPRRPRRVECRETVGAVALDFSGTLAAGASTGGIGFMLPGRVGDSPIIGSGVYADDQSGAVSMTGLGESIMRIAAGKEISDRLEAGLAPGQAARLVLRKVTMRARGGAGALVLARDGRFAIRHTTSRMAAGYWNGRGKPIVGDQFK